MRKKYLLRFIILLIIVILFVLYSSYPCLKLKLSSIPKDIKNNVTEEIDGLLFIYGDSICATCPQGKFIFERVNSITTLIIYPPRLRQFEVSNFKENYNFDTVKAILGDKDVEIFLKTIYSCSKNTLPFNRCSFYIKLDKNKNIKKYYIF
ncbi:MAG TPA: hypothetical protein VK469_20085 [Candidatus Kapabacteria bacterium]|nr:hypothetical protein [Candidatus Kapabacteria bacterium]